MSENFIDNTCNDIHITHDLVLKSEKWSMNNQNQSNSTTGQNKKSRSKLSSKTDKKVFPSHIQQIQTEEGIIQFNCICGKRFRSRSQQYYHLSCDNTVSKKYKCLNCEKCFSSRSHLNYHQDTHHSSSEYQCDQCERKFINRVVWRKHQKLHDIIIPSACEQCTKSFRCKASLAAHVAAQHQYDLRHQCPQCEKKYATKSTLQQHMLKHTDKQHACCHCGKRFQRFSTLKTHLQKHEQAAGGLVCTACSRKFSDASALLRHTKMHKDSILKYRCTRCDIISTRKDNMLRHVRNMHLGESFQQCIEIQNPPQIHTQIEINEVEILTHTTDKLPPIQLKCNNLPKTVANSSVIKCIGNVEPIEVPLTKKTDKQLQPANTKITPMLTTLQNVASNSTSAVISKPKKVKEKYNPIEMYKKILIADVNDDDTEQQNEQFSTNHTPESEHIMTDKPSSSIVSAVDNSNVVPQHRTHSNVNSISMSNFSEMHWRKNFAYTYEYQEC